MENTIVEALDIQFIMFEVVPLERLGIDEVVKDIQSIAFALQQIGFEPLYNFIVKDTLWFSLNDKRYFEEFVKTALSELEDELVWLLTDFIEYIVLLPTSYDLLFALASTKKPNNTTPYSVELVSTTIGGFTYPSSLARILCASALNSHGNVDLGTNISCTSSFPRETALSGDIWFLPTLAEYHWEVHLFDRKIFRELSLISSQKLTSQNIAELLTNETLLDQLEIAKVYPMQLGQLTFGQNSFYSGDFSLFNHFTVKAIAGTKNEILRELVNVSIHFNWSYAAISSQSKLSRKLALPFGFAQLRRWKNLEEKEKSLRDALGLLQRRYPGRQELLQWETNNLYSNIIRYSPAYLTWYSHLMAFIQNDSGMGNQFTLRVRQIDWEFLEALNIVTTDEGEKIVKLLQTDPGALLTKMRVIIEQCILYIHQKKYPHIPMTTLHNMIMRLDRDSVFPPLISIYLTTLRTSGNIGAHTGTDSKEDVEALLPLFVRVLEWFIDEGTSKI